jgi:hypothetical protein
MYENAVFTTRCFFLVLAFKEARRVSMFTQVFFKEKKFPVFLGGKFKRILKSFFSATWQGAGAWEYCARI